MATKSAPAPEPKKSKDSDLAPDGLRAAAGLTDLASLGLSHAQLGRLRTLSVSSAEELLGLFYASPEPSAAYLGLNDISQIQARAARRSAGTIQALEGMSHARFALGAVRPPEAPAVKPDEARNEEAAAKAASAVRRPGKSAVDHRSCMGPVRDQGDRGTCVAHAVAAVFECLIVRAGWAQIDLSEQFLYWASKERDGAPTKEGTYVEVAAEQAIEKDGICTERIWPYNPAKIPGNEGQGPPPPGASKDAHSRRARSIKHDETSVAELKAVLADGNPFAFSVPVYENWYSNPATHLYGFIPMPLPFGRLKGGHAMCAVGYGLDADFAGGGYFIVRNSWGTGWAPLSPIEAGYGALPFAYIAGYGWEAYGLELP